VIVRVCLAVSLVLAASVCVLAADERRPVPLAVGDVFPPLKAEFLTGRTAVLPDAARGKSALIMMGFTYDSRHAVEAWAWAFRDAFAGRQDVTFFQVPVIGGMGRLAKPFIDAGMRKGTPSALHENVITVYGNVDYWKGAMGFVSQAEHAPYLVLIDREGRVRWLYRGVCTPGAMASLRDALSP
jgi:hypothetical protein